jgi:hypothetical protein
MNNSAKNFNPKCFKLNFYTNTFVGFDDKEIEKTSDEDLILMRKDIYLYLTNRRLKKRNSNFKNVFYRINKELKMRKSNKLMNTAQTQKMKYGMELSKKSDIFKNSSCPVIPLNLDVKIPNFLNDRLISESLKVDEYENCECRHCQIKKLVENSLKNINECINKK